MRRAQTERGAAVISYAELKTQRLPKKTRKLLKHAIKLDEKGATEDALSLVERALASAPTYVEAHTAAAIANLKLDRLGELESALQHHQEAERLNRRPFRPRRDPSELERDLDGAGWVR